MTDGKINALEFYAYVGEDDVGGRVGLRRTAINGMPLIGMSAPPETMRLALQGEVNQSRKPIYLVKLTVAEIIHTVTPKADA